VDVVLWGTGGPLMWAAILGAVLTAVFALQVRWWLRAFPVTPLNWAYETKYRQHYPTRTVQPTNMLQVFAASATSSVSHIHLGVQYKRDREALIWTGHLPEVGS
jgi:hypothetical protein